MSSLWTTSFNFHLSLVDIGQDCAYIQSEKVQIHLSMLNANMFIKSSCQFYTHCDVLTMGDLHMQDGVTFKMYSCALFDASVESINTISNKRYVRFFC